MFLLKMIDTAEAYLGAKVSDAVVNQLTTAFCSWCSLRRKKYGWYRPLHDLLVCKEFGGAMVTRSLRTIKAIAPLLHTLPSPILNV